MPVVWMLGAVGAAFLALAVATAIPALAGAGFVYLLVAWWWRPRRGRPVPWWVTVAVALVGVIGGALAAVIGLLAQRAAPPVPDAFYTAPAEVPAAPGRLLRVEPFTRVVPPGTRVSRMLYTTTRAEGVPAVASAIVVAPASGTAAGHPVVAWTHGTTGVAPGCGPTVLPAPFPFDATLPALDAVVARQWVLIGPDYVGLGAAGGHPYLIGEAEARSTLDALRAASEIAGLGLDGRAVVWGHSQGGHAALWTGMLAPGYAPELGLSGIAALAPATELGALVEAAQHTPVGQIMASYVTTAYSQAYPDVRLDDYVGPQRRSRAMAGRCLSGAGALVSVLTALTMESPFFVQPPSAGALGRRLAENVPAGPIAAPLLIAQGLDDDLVLPDVQAGYVRARCAAGQALDYRTYAGRDHLSVVAPDSPLSAELVAWTEQRFAGEPAVDGCLTTKR